MCPKDYREAGIASDDKTCKTDMAGIPRPTGPQKSFLIQIHGPNLGKIYPITEQAITLGRDANTTIQIDVKNVSRVHCRLENIDDEIFLEDLNSTNGTYLNDVAIRRTRLRHGDLIKVDGVVFKFLKGSNTEVLYHEEIYKMTITDGLTQVANKRYLLEFLDREIARAIRFARALSLLMMDLDHFKRVNDTYGHLAGDYVLKETANLLNKLVRKEELLARYGGEEFVVVLPETGLTTACTIGEKARRMVEQHSFEFAGVKIPVTISIGAAELSPMTAYPLDFLNAADKKLYEAKDTGRNRVMG